MKRTRQSSSPLLRQEIEGCYNLFLQKANDIIFVYEASSKGAGKILEANDQACRVLGYSQEEFLRMSMKDIDVPENKKNMSMFMKRLREAGQVISQTEILTKKGKRIPVEVSANLLEINSRSVVMSIFRDITKQKQVEEEISSAKTFLDTIIDNSPFAMWVSDKEGTVIKVNRSLCDIIKLTKDKIVGKYNVLKDKNLKLQGVIPQVKAIFTKHKPARFSIMWKAEYAGDVDFRTARDMHIDVSMFPILNAQGKLTNVVCQWVDITDQIHTEEELRKSEVRYRTFFSTSRDAVFITSLDGRWLEMNDAAVQMFGYSNKAELMSVSIPDLYVKKEERTKHINTIIERGYSIDYPVDLLKKNGAVMHALITATVRHDEKGNVIGFMGTIKDITESRIVQDALEESELKLRTIFNSTLEGILVIQIQGKKFVQANKAICEMLGYAEEEILKLSMVDIHPKESLSYISNEFDKLIKREITIAHDILILRKDKTVFFADISSSRISLEGEECLIGIFRDATERRKAEEILRERDFILRKLSANVPGMIYQFKRRSDGSYCVPFTTEAIKDIFGCLPEDVVNDFSPITKVVYDEDLEKLMSSIEDSAKNMTQWQCEYRVQLPGKPVQWRYGTSTPEKLPDGSIIWHGFNADITERKLAEEEIKRQKAFVDNLFNTTNDTIFVFEPETGKAIRWNDDFRRVSGYSDDEIASLKVPDAYYNKEDLIRAQEAVKNIIHEGKAVVELNLLTKDGRFIPFEYNASSLKDETGTPRWVIAMGRDITRRKKAEEDLRKSEENLRLLVENAPDAIFIRTGPDFVYVNKAALKLFGADSTDQLIGQPVMERYHPDYRENIRECIHLLDEKKVAVPINVQKYLKLNGTVVDVEVSAVPFRFENTDGSLVFVRDITERKWAEEMLTRDRELLEEMGRITLTGAWEMEVETGKQTWTDETYEIFDRKRNEYDPDTAEAISQFEPASQILINKALKEAITQAVPFDLDLKMTTVKDNRKWIRVICHPVVESGRVTQLKGTVQDITERRRIGEALRESQRFSVATIDALLEHICVLDETGRIVTVNRAWRTFADENPPVPTNVCEGANYLAVCDAVIGPDATQAAAFAAGIRAVIRGERTDFSMEYSCHSPDKQRWFVGRITRFFGEGPVFVVVAHENITERKQTEKLVQIRLQLMNYAMNHKREEVMQKTLDEIGEFTGSPIGFYHFLKDDQKTLSLQTWSTRTLREFCAAEGKGRHYGIEEAGVWVDCVHQRRPVIHNDYASLSHRKGMPEGHAKVVRELVVPVMRNERIVAILGVGNKPSDYDEKDIEIVAYLADVAWEIAEHKRAEDALKKSEERFKAQYHGSSIPTYTWQKKDDDFVLVDFNSAAETATGGNIWTYLHKAAGEMYRDRQDVLQNLHRCFEKKVSIKKDFPSEHFMPGKYIMVTYSFVPNDLVLVQAEDITERKHMEEELHESEKKFRAVFENSAAAIALINPDETIEDVNKAYLRVGGYTRDKVVGKSWTSQVVPEDLERMKELNRRRLRGERGLPAQYEFGFVNESGEKRAAWMSVARIPATNKLVASFVDITERKRAEEEIKKLASIVRFSSELVNLTTLNGKMIFLNEAGSEMLGIAQEKTGNYSIMDVIAEKYLPTIREQLLPALHAGKEWKGELQYRNIVTGRLTDVYATTFSIRDKATGKVVYLANVSRDITEYKRAEEEIRNLNMQLEERVKQRTAELAKANRELESFSYSVSHDLRAPLRHIIGFSEILQNTAVNLDEKSLHCLNNIVDSTKRMGELIDDLLSFSRMGRVELRNAAINAEKLIRDVIKELSEDTQGRNIVWDINPLPIVTGDAAMLKIVFINLIANAIKFTRFREDARITIGSIPSENKETVFFVRDNGVGFDMKYVDNLFGVFQRLHSRRDFEGTGIGLANVKRIVERHGGKVWAEGATDSGATFYISLPKEGGEK